MIKGSIYKRGSNQLRKLYRVNGHMFRTKGFKKVCKIFNNNTIIFIYAIAI